MNRDIGKGKWMQVDGDREQLIGKVQERYGIARDAAERRSTTGRTPSEGAILRGMLPSRRRAYRRPVARAGSEAPHVARSSSLGEPSRFPRE